jgi:iron(III) transport system substrate-binding protein
MLAVGVRRRMKIDLFRSFILVFFVACSIHTDALSAAPSGNTLAAVKQPELNSYTFITSHNEIIAKAKQEGGLRALVNMRPANIAASADAFRKRYPFIKLDVKEATGTENAQRLLLELKTLGRAANWDIIDISSDFFSQFVPLLMKVDVLGMAQKRVLQIPTAMIDSINRNIVAFSSRFTVTIYSKTLLPASQIPKTWEDLLKPELKGKKFAVDIRPTEIAAMVPAWGLESTLEFARKIKEQDPIWVRGSTRTMAAILAGEIPMMVGPNWHNMKEYEPKDPTGVLRYAILEPTPVRFGNRQAILAGTPHLHTALLWLEWMASEEAQRITDEKEPLASSIYVRGGAVEGELKGKKLSVVGWEEEQFLDGWQAKVVEAYGFPKAGSGK